MNTAGFSCNYGSVPNVLTGCLRVSFVDLAKEVFIAAYKIGSEFHNFGKMGKMTPPTEIYRLWKLLR